MSATLRSRRRLLTLLAGAMVPAVLLAQNGQKASNKWRIECSGGARSAGSIVFRVTPVGGAPIEVTVNVRDGRGENAVARDIRDAFRASLDRKKFHVETDDGEDVLVKRRWGQPTFLLELVSSSVQNVRLKLERE